MNERKRHFIPNLIEKLQTWALNDGEFFRGAMGLARKYMEDSRYPDNDARVDSLILCESAKSFACGFLSGLGGITFLPVGLSAGLAFGLLLQIRLCRAIDNNIRSQHGRRTGKANAGFLPIGRAR